MPDISQRVFLLFGHVPKTNAEKRRAVTHALDDLGLWRQPDAWIAKQCFVSRSLVADVRKELERAQVEETAFLALMQAWSGANDAVRMRFFSHIERERAWRARPEVQRVAELIDLGLKVGVVTQSGLWFSFDSIRLGQGRENAEAFLITNREITDKLRRFVRAADLDCFEEA
jgi:hypothetical protein